MRDPSSARPRYLRPLLIAVGLVVLLGAMALQTTWLSPGEAASLNPTAFNAKTYAEENYPKAVTSITDKAVDITTLAPAVAADVAAAGKKYGVDLGSGKYAFPVKATGTVTSADANFALIQVAGVPEGTTVRIPLGAAVSGTPVRDATGTIKYSDFVGQTDYQSVANQFKLKTQTEVIAKLDAASLPGKQITVVGAYSTGGPAGSYIIQPVSVTEA